VAAPLAILGSIGVITEIPNFYERLTKEGVKFNTITAGKFKRQLTPTKKTTPEDIAKTTQDLEDILVLFKGFIQRNRPSLDVDDVATGEIWFGPDALEKNLCDELKTSDDVLQDLLKDGHEVYSVTTKQGSDFADLLTSVEESAGATTAAGRLLDGALRMATSARGLDGMGMGMGMGGGGAFGYDAIDAVREQARQRNGRISDKYMLYRDEDEFPDLM